MHISSCQLLACWHAVIPRECYISRRTYAQFQQLLLLQDNDLEREFQVHRTESDYALAEFWKWVIACMIGLSMGCIGFAVDWGITLLHDAKYQNTASVLKSTGTLYFFRLALMLNVLSRGVRTRTLCKESCG